jgi:hypothetical protein
MRNLFAIANRTLMTAGTRQPVLQAVVKYRLGHEAAGKESFMATLRAMTRNFTPKTNQPRGRHYYSGPIQTPTKVTEE